MVEVLNLNQAENKKTLQTSFESTVLWAVSDWKLTPEESFLLVESFNADIASCKASFEKWKDSLISNSIRELHRLAVDWWFKELVTAIETRCWDNISSKTENKETSQSELFDYFQINHSSWNKLLESFKEYWFNFDLKNFLLSYKNFFENNLKWLDESLLSNISKAIWIKIFGILKIIENRVSFVENQIKKWNYSESDEKQEILNQRWIINSQIQQSLSFINDRVLPSAVLLLKYNKNPSSIIDPDKWFSPTWEEKYNLRHQIQEIRNLFDTIEVNWKWDIDWEYFTKALFDNNRSYDNRLWEANDLNLELPSILNEQDKEIESNAQMYFMWAIWSQIAIEMWPAALMSILPWIWTSIWATIWSIAWWTIDAWDMFSDSEVLLDLVQKAWFVDKNYRMDKTYIDNILAWIWLLPWMTALVKWKKIATFLSKLSPEKQWMFSNIFEKVFKFITESIYWENKVSWKWKIINNSPTNDNIKPSSNLPANEKLPELQSKWKDWIYLSKFSDRVPEHLKKEWDVLAWVNLDWSVSYNKSLLEEKIWLKLSQEWDNVLFDWLSIKDYIRASPEKWGKLMSYLKMLKWHEMTHNLLQTKKITRIAVPMPDWTTKIFTQEYICRIVDGSMEISLEEKLALEETLKLEFWPDFKLDSDYIRNRATREIADWRDVSREVEAARSTQNTLNISENDNSLIDLTILSWKNIDWVAMQIEEFWKKVKLDVFLYLNNWNNKAVAQLRLEEIQAISRYIDSRIPKWLTKNERTQFILYFQSMEEKLKRYIDFSTDARLINLFDNFLSKIEEKHKLIQNIF